MRDAVEVNQNVPRGVAENILLVLELLLRKKNPESFLKLNSKESPFTLEFL